MTARQPCEREAPFVMMHVPKTAGTAITRALIQSRKPQRTLWPAYDGMLFGSFDGFDDMRPEFREHIYLDIDRMPSDADFVAGHVSFSTLQQRYPEAQRVTFLREPISRVLSHWIFFRGLSAAALEAWEPYSSMLRISHNSLLRFASDPRIACQIDNLYARMLLWPHRLIPNGGFIARSSDDTLLEEATARLARFSYSDVIENPEFASQLQAWLGTPLSIERINETPSISGDLKPDLRNEMSAAALEVLLERTRLDSALWQVVASQHGGKDRLAVLEKTGLLQSVMRFAQQ